MDHSSQAVQVFNKYAKQYHEKFSDVSAYAGSLNLFCRQLTNNDPAILELACGPGNITRYILKQKPDAQVLATDLAPNMLAIARLINPEARFKLMDCRDLLKLEKKFDGIICGFCLPYLTKEESIQLIGNASKILTEQGALYISTMEDDNSKSGLQRGSGGEEMYMNYHEAGYLNEAVRANKMTVIDLQRKIYREEDGRSTTDLVIVAKKDG
jgi:trans-aconitate methyltransferase